MYIMHESEEKLSPFIRKEVSFDGGVEVGAKGKAARRVQEWLVLNGHQIVADGDYGAATEAAVRKFQQVNGLPVSGAVDAATHEKLISPMTRVLKPAIDLGPTFGATVAALAEWHLAVHPREAGGDNLGPWVRLYMDGNEGTAWFWCVGFVTFLMKQAAELRGQPMPIEGSFSCDSLAFQGKKAKAYLEESKTTPSKVTDGSIFLVRRTSDDWIHTGIVMNAGSSVFETVEGNTNDDGHHNGYEVCRRQRGYGDKDFVLL